MATAQGFLHVGHPAPLGANSTLFDTSAEDA